VTGESYAGVYIPSLAYQILTNNSDSQLASNLKKGGLMLGNPVTNCKGSSYAGDGSILNLNDQLNLFYWHGMVSRRDFDEWNSKGCNTASPAHLLECYVIYGRVQRGIGHLDQPLQSEEQERRHRRVQPAGSINPDMLYFSYCAGNGTLDFATDIVPDCFDLDDQVSTYLNDPAVQAAVNARAGTQWSECTSKLAYRKLGVPAPNYLEQFFQIAPQMRIMYYSGDVDLATVPFSQTQRCLETMDRPIVQSWRPYVINKEVAGYVEIYDTYTYATIKGAGHEAPQFQPAAAFLLFSTFLHNGTLPTVTV
jgi:serine carboxypeptidase-like clade II